MKKYAMTFVFMGLGIAAGLFIHPNLVGVGAFFALISAMGK